MRMVPRSPYDTNSQAEKRIFEQLRGAFDKRYAAYHSLKPTRHPHKRFPEIDFVTCGPEGLYVLEVKGGDVSCRGVRGGRPLGTIRTEAMSSRGHVRSPGHPGPFTPFHPG